MLVALALAERSIKQTIFFQKKTENKFNQKISSCTYLEILSKVLKFAIILKMLASPNF
jgi:hypothetical protein